MSRFFAVDNLRAVTGGRWLRQPASGAVCDGVGIDTRSDLAAKAYVAIRGERHDGHDFLQQAAVAGATLLVVHREPVTLPEGVGVLLVDDTRRALRLLATAYRRTLTNTTVIAITGSAGKTTTKSLVDPVLGAAMTGTCARKSFNNDIGVPLTILSASPEDRYLLLEIGTNAPGEIDALASIAQPDIAAITLIGRSHLEGLGSVEDVAVEKAALLRHLRPGGQAILHADSPQLRAYVNDCTITFGESEDAHLRLTGRGGGDGTWWFELNDEQRFGIGLPGKHNAVNAIVAVAIGRVMGLNDAVISAALATVRPAEMRFVPQQWGGMTFFNDAYNANPDSMIAALDTFAEVTGDSTRRIVILGDMLELGERAVALHQEVGRHLANLHRRCPISRAILIGPLAVHIGEYLDEALTIHLPALTDGAIETIHAEVREGDAVLLKGSRRCALERIVTNQSPGIAAHGLSSPI